jgi:ABC-type multidrug transport system ATPase subunit
MAELLRMIDVSVRYGWRTVLRNISLEIVAGEVLALLGPNAAGKTTLLRTLVGSLRPEKGEIVFQKAQKNAGGVGWVDHQSFLFDELTLEENLRFWAAILNVPQSEKRIDELIERFDLGLMRDERLETLSFGLIKRAAICRAILARPSVLLLDEAFNGLDQVGTDQLIQLLGEYRRSSSAVVLTSHQVSLAVDVATDLAVLHHGRLILKERAGACDRKAVEENYLAYALCRQKGEARER